MERDTVWAPELCSRSYSPIAGEAGDPGSSERRNDAGSPGDSADDVIVSLDNVKVPRLVKLDLVGHVQGSLSRWPPVPAVASFAVSSYRDRIARTEIQASNQLIIPIAEVERAIRSDDDAVWVVDLLKRIARHAVADHG